jgi:hypothetical protein
MEMRSLGALDLVEVSSNLVMAVPSPQACACGRDVGLLKGDAIVGAERATAFKLSGKLRRLASRSSSASQRIGFRKLE